MADFLTRLAGRTIGLVPTVQPIIAPMYAPRPGITGERSDLVVLKDETSSNLDGQYQVPPSPVRNTQQGFSEQAPLAHPVWGTGNPLSGGQVTLPLKDDTPLETPMGILPPMTPAHTQSVPGFPLDTLPLQIPQGNVPSITPTQSESLHKMVDTQSAPGLPVPQTGFPQGIALQIASVPASRRGSPEGVPPGQFPTYLTEDSPVQVEPPTPNTTRNRIEQKPTGYAVNLPESPPDSHSFSSQSPGIPEIRPASPSVQRPAVRGAARPQGAINLAPTHLEHMRVLPTNQREVVSESSSAAPTIQVTIGRIEVRAIPPPTPRPQNQRSATTVMSLDDYLNQRARGGH